MKPWRLVAMLLCGAFFLPMFAVAADDDADDKAPKKPSAKERFAEIAKLGKVPHAGIRKDKKGRILSVLVVGKGRISTVLGAAKGEEDARERADLDASTNFVTWLRDEVSVIQSSDEETITLMEGTEENGEATNKESAKNVLTDKKKKERIAKGLVRGLDTVYFDINEDKKTFTVVKAWLSDTSEATKKIIADSASDSPAESKAATPKRGKEGEEASKKKKLGTTIKNDSALSEGAEALLP